MPSSSPRVWMKPRAELVLPGLARNTRGSERGHGQAALHRSSRHNGAARTPSREEPRMITRFGSLFAGHVDLEDEGLDGTPANDRWLSDEHLAQVFPKSEAIA